MDCNFLMKSVITTEDCIELYPDEALLEEYRKKLPKRKEKGVKTEVEADDKKEARKDKEQRAPKRKAEADSAIQNDPSKSDAYKNLFTTCEAAKKKPEGPWVTHNPLFY